MVNTNSNPLDLGTHPISHSVELSIYDENNISFTWVYPVVVLGIFFRVVIKKLKFFLKKIKNKNKAKLEYIDIEKKKKFKIFLLRVFIF